MMPTEEVLRLALGPTWTQLRGICESWFRTERDRLRSDWPPESIDDETLLSFELGLYMHSFDDPDMRYDVTPTPGWAFARTGVDGEHLSVLTGEHSGLVVLTAPMAFDAPNLVVGESLIEFLSFVCFVGTSQLTSICYRGGLAKTETIESGEPTALHRHLIRELALAAPEHPLERLRELSGMLES